MKITALLYIFASIFFLIFSLRRVAIEEKKFQNFNMSTLSLIYFSTTFSIAFSYSILYLNSTISSLGIILFASIAVTLITRNFKKAIEDAWISLLILAVAITPFFWALNGIALNNGPDDFSNGFSNLVYLSHIINSGELPLWNSNNWIGNPYGGDPMWGVWNPINLWFSSLIALLSDGSILNTASLWEKVFTLYRITISWVGCLGLYILVRHYSGVSKIGAIIAIIPFAFSVDIQFYNWTTLCLMPWFLICLRYALLEKRGVYIISAGYFLGFMVLGGQVKMVVYIAFCAIFLQADLLLKFNKDNIKKYFLIVLCIGILGILISLPLLIGSDAYIRSGAYRWINDGITGLPINITASSGLRYIDTTIQSKLSIEYILSSRALFLLFPLFFLGVAGLLFKGVFALRLSIFIALILFASINFGEASITSRLMYKFLPGWNHFRAHTQIFYPAIIFFSILVGLGYRSLTEEGGKNIKLIINFILTTLITVTILMAIKKIGYNANPIELIWNNKFGLFTFILLFFMLLNNLSYDPINFSKIKFMEKIHAYKRIIFSFFSLVIILMILVPWGDIFSSRFHYPRSYVGESPRYKSDARDVYLFLQPEIIKGEKTGQIFRVDTRNTDFLNKFFGFLYNVETVGGYGGLSLKSSATGLWHQNFDDNNIRYEIYEKSLANKAKDLKMVYQNSSFIVYERPFWKSRFRIDCINPTVKESPRVEIITYRKNNINLNLNDVGGCKLINASAFSSHWKVLLNGKETTNEYYKGWQSINFDEKTNSAEVTFSYGSGLEKISPLLYILLIIFFPILIGLKFNKKYNS